MGLKHWLKLPSLISLKNEPFLEKWARLFRFREITPSILSYLQKNTGSVTVVDYGCGQDILYKKYMNVQFSQYAHRLHYVGIDPLIHEEHHDLIGHAKVIRSKFEEVKLPKKADIIVMLAVLEHVDDASVLLESALRLLKPGGMIIGTTPSPLSKVPLEFFSYNLGIISTREIEEHKRYPTKESIEKAAKLAGKRVKKQVTLTHHYFELGLNNYFEIRSL